MANNVSVTVCPGHCVDNGKKQYLPGESLKLDDAAAEDLIERGIVAPAKADQPSEDKPGAKKTKK